MVSIILTNSGFSQKIVWTPKASLPQVASGGAAVVCNDKIYYILENNESFFEYDPETDQWTAKTGKILGGTHFAAASVNGLIYVIGGGAGTWTNNDICDPVNGTWTSGALMPTKRAHIKAAVVNDKIYIIGGLTPGSVHTENEVYDPQTNTWETKAPIPVAKEGYGISVINNKIYVFGGSTDLHVLTNTVHVYDPALDSWEEISPMPANRWHPAIATVDNKVIITGGYEDLTGEPSKSTDIYDLATDFWTQADSLPINNAQMGYAGCNGSIYTMGGSIDGGITKKDNVYQGTLIDVSINQNNKINLKIYPNPAQNTLHIEYPGLIHKNVSYKIIDLDGKTLQHGKLINNTIDISRLQKGIYIMNFDIDGEIVCKRIII